MPSRRSVLAGGALSLSTLVAGCNLPSTGSTEPTRSDGLQAPTLTVAVDGLGGQLGRLARIWNTNRQPDPDGSDQFPRYLLDDERGLADYFGERHGFEPTGEPYNPPFRIAIVGETRTNGDIAITDETVDICEAWGHFGPDASVSVPEGVRRHDLFRTGEGFFVSEPVYESGVETLSVADLEAIYEGRVTNWREVGGPDREIHLVMAAFSNPGSRFDRTFRSQLDLGSDYVAKGNPRNRWEIVASRDDAIARLGFSDLGEVRTDGDGATRRIDVIVDGERRGPDEPGYPGTYPNPIFTNGDPAPRERAVLDALTDETIRTWLAEVSRTLPLAKRSGSS